MTLGQPMRGERTRKQLTSGELTDGEESLVTWVVGDLVATGVLVMFSSNGRYNFLGGTTTPPVVGAEHLGVEWAWGVVACREEEECRSMEE